MSTTLSHTHRILMALAGNYRIYSSLRSRMLGSWMTYLRATPPSFGISKSSGRAMQPGTRYLIRFPLKQKAYGVPSMKQTNNVFNRPQPIRHTSSHRRSHPQSLMNPNEVVIHVEDR